MDSKFKYIAHRGNTVGPKPNRENDPEYISEALLKGFDVEVDVWVKNGNFILGHDEPVYGVNQEFLQDERIWCHAKNLAALKAMLDLDIHCFFHDTDDFTITNRKIIWTFPGKEVTNRSVIVLTDLKPFDGRCFGICSDYVEFFRDESK